MEVKMDSSPADSSSVQILNPFEAKIASIRELPRGIAKSGRFWKEPKMRASSMKKHKRDTLGKKMKEREDRDRCKALSQRLRDAISEKERLKRERTEENKKRREENAKKSEIVQKITDTTKIKKMKKKQLRRIEKRDTTEMK